MIASYRTRLGAWTALVMVAVALFGATADAAKKRKARTIALVVLPVESPDPAMVDAIQTAVVDLVNQARSLTLISGEELAGHLEGDPLEAATACGGDDLGCLATLGVVAGADEFVLTRVFPAEFGTRTKFTVVSASDSVMITQVELTFDDLSDIGEKLRKSFQKIFRARIPKNTVVADSALTLEALPDLPLEKPLPKETATAGTAPAVTAPPDEGGANLPLLIAGVALTAVGAGLAVTGGVIGINTDARMDALYDGPEPQVSFEGPYRDIAANYDVANGLFGGAAGAGAIGLVLIVISVAQTDEPPTEDAASDPGASASLGFGPNGGVSGAITWRW